MRKVATVNYEFPVDATRTERRRIVRQAHHDLNMRVMSQETPYNSGVVYAPPPNPSTGTGYVRWEYDGGATVEV